MALIKRNQNLFPFDLFDEFFNTEVSNWKRKNYATQNSTLPKVNIREDQNGYVVEMAAPGLKKDDFKIELDQNVLSISSENKEAHKNEDEGYSRQEFAFQSFCRSFTLPETADSAQIKAKYHNGILEIGIPKKEEAKPQPPKTIKVS
ncbi:MAG: Hsp20/alpha crystallin family protein [Candidatus Cyclobacteriaceae bacterium M3_2C_046]